MTTKTTRAYDRIIDQLRHNGQIVKETSTNRAIAQCPAHNDGNPSLSLKATETKTLLHCFAGCDLTDILTALNATPQDLFDEPRTRYDYADRHGTIIRSVTRSYDPTGQKKTFRPTGGDVTAAILYRLPKITTAVTQGTPIYLVEGEEDVHAIESEGAIATTGPQGANSIGKTDFTPLTGAHIIAVIDKDPAGQKWATKVQEKATEVGVASLKFVEAATGKDAADHIAAGHALDDLIDITDQMTPATPVTPDTATTTTTTAATPNDIANDLHGQVRFAHLLAHHYNNTLMYVQNVGWHAWDGTRWVEATTQTQQAVIALLHDTWLNARDDKTLEKDVRACESASGIEGILKIASRIPTLHTTVNGLDTDPYLVNCANGTVDLRTMELRPHDPTDRLTKATTGAYHPDTDRSRWNEFLTSVLPDEDERAYLQRVVGQALYGGVREHLFPVLIGTGANGKGTFYGAVQHALGDYVKVIDPALLMASDRDRNPGPEMMELLGARLVIGSETADGRKLDEATMKRLSGGDLITARRLYREPVTWTPTHQLFYVTNHLPVVKGNDPAVWRRIRVIPFDVVVPVEQRDPELPERLQLEADAILTWAIEGYRAYTQIGMREPASVAKATGEYQNDSDAVARFVKEACMTSPVATATTRSLFTAWQKFAIAEGAEAISEKAFSNELERLGFTSKRTKRGVTWTGLEPYQDDSDELFGG